MNNNMLKKFRAPLRRLGPAMFTGAADDDPSSISTYSQAGAQLGYAMRRRLTANVTSAFLRPVVLGVVTLQVLANTLEVGADIAAWAKATDCPGSLKQSVRLGEYGGRSFYGVVALATLATLGGVILCFTPMDPLRELFWSAVVNGVIAVLIMAVMMRLSTHKWTMGAHVIGQRLRWLGWLATAAMAATVLAMLATLRYRLREPG